MCMIHTFFMFLGLVVMLVPSLRSAGGFAGLSAALPESYFSFGSGGFWSVAAVLLGAVLAIMTSPLAFMSVVSSTKPKIAKNALRICAVLILPFAACLVLIGMCCRVIVPEGSANAVLFDVAQSFNPACYVLIGMSVLAATFSTAPASLLSIITTLNKGPLLTPEIRAKLFTAGYTTKTCDRQKHGLGLYNLRRLVFKYNGKIYLENDYLLDDTLVRFEVMV